MNTKRRLLLITLLVAVFVLTVTLFVACDDETQSGNDEPSYDISYDVIEVWEDATLDTVKSYVTLTVTKNNVTTPITDFTLSGDLKVGRCMITLTYGDYVDTFPVSVLPYPEITFMVDGEVLASVKYKPGDTSIQEPAVPERKGYTGEWTNYTLGRGGATVYAIYSPKTYNVTLDYNGAEEGIGQSNIDVIYDNFVPTLPYPQKMGYDFLGWFLNGNNMQPHQTVWTVDSDEPLTLVAKWQIIEYTVTFRLNDEILGTSTYTVENKNIVEPPIPAKEGYIGKYDYDRDALPNWDIDVFAYYEAKTYTVALNYNGADSGNDEQTAVVEYDGLFDLPLPQKDNHVFDGWWFGDQLIDELYQWKTDTDEQLTLNARWQLGTEGLNYVYATYLETVSIYGMGDVTDSEIVIPFSYRGKPVCKVWFASDIVTKVTVSEGIQVIHLGGSVNLQQINVPSTVSELSLGGCTNLTDVVIADGATVISEYAFSNCIKLQTITIPDSVTRLGESAFYGCSGLTDIIVGNGLSTIEAATFRNCANLQNVTLGKGITQIKSDAFVGCENIEKVYFLGDIGDWCSINFPMYTSNPIYSGAKLYIDDELVTDVVVPDSVTVLMNTFYKYEWLETVVLGANVINVDWYTFSYCVNLRSVELNDKLTNIGAYAFLECTSLTSVIIPDSVLTLGMFAFGNCSGLDTVYFGKGVTSVGSAAFANCGFVEVYYSGSLNEWCGISFNGTGSAPAIKYLYINNAVISGDVVLADGITAIPEGTFCESLITSIYLPGSLKVIGNRAFYRVDRLQHVYYGGDVEGWCNIDFNDYPLNTGANLYFDGQLVTDIVIPDTVTAIGARAFYMCQSLTSIVIGSGVKSIGEYAFSYCNKLTIVYYMGSEQDWEQMDIGTDNRALSNASRYYYSETEPEESGNYWHWVNDEPVAW